MALCRMHTCTHTQGGNECGSWWCSEDMDRATDGDVSRVTQPVSGTLELGPSGRGARALSDKLSPAVP